MYIQSVDQSIVRNLLKTLQSQARFVRARPDEHDEPSAEPEIRRRLPIRAPIKGRFSREGLRTRFCVRFSAPDLCENVTRGFVQCACITYCVYEYVGDIVVCTGPSMEPTLYTNDVLLMERISIRLERFNKGDIVISKCPTNPKQNICKRIVGLPGDKIKNGSNVTMIPSGHVWLEGDNSSNSTDSRIYGPVPQGLLRGRALCKILPLREITMFTTKCIT